MSLNLSEELKKFSQYNGYYKYSDIASISKLFDAEIIVSPTATAKLPAKHIAIFPSPYSIGYLVFINTGSESVGIRASHQ